MARLPLLLAAFLPIYLRHLLVQPYRAVGSGPHLADLLRAPGRRHHIAMYDAVIEIMLNGYAELARVPLRPDTGQVAVKLMHLGFAFDDELEHRAAGARSLDFEAVFGGSGVRRPLAEWRGFMQGFDTYGAIRDFLFRYVKGLYAAHRIQAGAASFDELVAAEWDSGGLLVALAHVVARFHRSRPSEEIIRQFSSLGVTAKLADDMVDLRSDLAGHRPNLLDALAREDEREHAVMTQALTAQRRMSARWWRLNCPRSYARIAAVYEQHSATLTSRWLRLANELMWTPALVGHSSVADQRGRVLCLAGRAGRPPPVRHASLAHQQGSLQRDRRQDDKPAVQGLDPAGPDQHRHHHAERRGDGRAHPLDQDSPDEAGGHHHGRRPGHDEEHSGGGGHAAAPGAPDEDRPVVPGHGQGADHGDDQDRVAEDHQRAGHALGHLEEPGHDGRRPAGRVVQVPGRDRPRACLAQVDARVQMSHDVGERDRPEQAGPDRGADDQRLAHVLVFRAG
jgi:hypothetical protein